MAQYGLPTGSWVYDPKTFSGQIVGYDDSITNINNFADGDFFSCKPDREGLMYDFVVGGQGDLTWNKMPTTDLAYISLRLKVSSSAYTLFNAIWNLEKDSSDYNNSFLELRAYYNGDLVLEATNVKLSKYTVLDYPDISGGKKELVRTFVLAVGSAVYYDESGAIG